jgi:uncharacterized protein YndB with AHSA1/START domain
MNTNASVREIVQDIELPVEKATVFSLLVTPSAICSWWGASQAIVIPEQGGLWIATWGSNNDRPDYITAAQIGVFNPPSRLVLTNFKYHSSSGPLPFKAEFAVEFALLPADNGSLLTVVQSGFPLDAVADAHLAACQKGWKATFDGIKRFLGEH